MDSNEPSNDTSMKTYPLVIEGEDEEDWEAWKKTVPRAYPSVGDRLIEFIKRDLESRQETNQGILERVDQLEDKND